MGARDRVVFALETNGQAPDMEIFWKHARDSSLGTRPPPFARVNEKLRRLFETQTGFPCIRLATINISRRRLITKV